MVIEIFCDWLILSIYFIFIVNSIDISSSYFINGYEGYVD